MKENFRSHLLVAAALVMICGLAFVALAGETETKVKVMKLGDEEIKLVIDDTTEVITLEDLADGEERSFKAGDREIMVKREGDELRVTMDGEGCIDGLHEHGKHARSMVWVTSDDEDKDVHKIVIRAGDDEDVHGKAIVVKRGDDEDEDVMAYHIMIDEDEFGDKIEKVIELKLDKLGEHISLEHLEELKDLAILKDIDINVDGKPMVVKVHGDRHMFIGKHDDGKVRFRCEETGSVLVVDAEKATEDTYVCPVTGCVMERVKEPMAKRIEVMVHEDDEDEEE
jgi:hypothetical protein